MTLQAARWTKTCFAGSLEFKSHPNFTRRIFKKSDFVPPYEKTGSKTMPGVSCLNE